MRLLDRYLLRSFLLPFVFCELGFFAIWLIFDLGTNLNDFISANASVPAIAGFYLGQLPVVAILFLPIGLLLALLYSLSRLSQSNEIISMLNAGVSLERVLLPLFFVGLIVSGLSAALNFRLAPHAEARRERDLAEIEAGTEKFEERRAYTTGYLFANRTEHRLWFVQKMPADLSRPLSGVEIVQQDAAGEITAKYYAPTAVYDESRRAWRLTGGTKRVTFKPDGEIDSDTFPPEQTLTGWSETPWRLASATLRPDHLSIPELREYLWLNADFTSAQLAPFRTELDYRQALPWGCLVVVCIAAPLGIVYSRRSVLAGVASAIFLFALILLLMNLFPALGRGNRLPAFWAAWTPNLLFTLIGLVLLRMRALNRDRLPATLAGWRSFLTVW